MFADRWVESGIYTTDMLDTSLDRRNIFTRDANTKLTKQHKYKLFVPVDTLDIDPLKPKYKYLGNVWISKSMLLELKTGLNPQFQLDITNKEDKATSQFYQFSVGKNQNLINSDGKLVYLHNPLYKGGKRNTTSKKRKTIRKKRHSKSLKTHRRKKLLRS